MRTLEPSTVAKFAFALAQRFNAFYHRQPIMKEERADVRLWRAAAVVFTRVSLTAALRSDGLRCSGANVMTKRPIIGVAWPKADYVSSLEQAGADVRQLVPEADALPAVLDGCDGVLLTGGADVDPARNMATPTGTASSSSTRHATDYEIGARQGRARRATSRSLRSAVAPRS